mmetsp:Transcript_36605/g.61194  ORF Transcript_36605/g.61194 Transcript_36605/m.61194 type:complete len:225 (-) Transcript_36605:421-1095(-)
MAHSASLYCNPAIIRILMQNGWPLPLAEESAHFTSSISAAGWLSFNASNSLSGVLMVQNSSLIFSTDFGTKDKPEHLWLEMTYNRFKEVKFCSNAPCKPSNPRMFSVSNTSLCLCKTSNCIGRWSLWISGPWKPLLGSTVALVQAGSSWNVKANTVETGRSFQRSMVFRKEKALARTSRENEYMGPCFSNFLPSRVVSFFKYLLPSFTLPLLRRPDWELPGKGP